MQGTLALVKRVAVHCVNVLKVLRGNHLVEMDNQLGNAATKASGKAKKSSKAKRKRNKGVALPLDQVLGPQAQPRATVPTHHITWCMEPAYTRSDVDQAMSSRPRGLFRFDHDVWTSPMQVQIMRMTALLQCSRPVRNTRALVDLFDKHVPFADIVHKADVPAFNVLRAILKEKQYAKPEIKRIIAHGFREAKKLDPRLAHESMEAAEQVTPEMLFAPRPSGAELPVRDVTIRAVVAPFKAAMARLDYVDQAAVTAWLVDAVAAPVQHNQHQLADAFELHVQKALKDIGVNCFLAQEQQKSSYGMPTPDILFAEPILINGQQCHWIELKNMFCIPAPGFLMTKLMTQVNKYTQHFGPGALMFSYGFTDDSLAYVDAKTYGNVMVLDGSGTPERAD
eukprot:m.199474 g.199474  ORF g.199474 m.199474 type:complete len:395 (+) comp14948_c0_seq1:50-1234(+)